MKQIFKAIAVIATALVLASCTNPNGRLAQEYRLTYNVHYPDTTVEKYKTFMSDPDEGFMSVSQYSFRGTDYIRMKAYRHKWYQDIIIKDLVSSTAPLEIVKYEKMED